MPLSSDRREFLQPVTRTEDLGVMASFERLQIIIPISKPLLVDLSLHVLTTWVCRGRDSNTDHPHARLNTEWPSQSPPWTQYWWVTIAVSTMDSILSDHRSLHHAIVSRGYTATGYSMLPVSTENWLRRYQESTNMIHCTILVDCMVNGQLFSSLSWRLEWVLLMVCISFLTLL